MSLGVPVVSTVKGAEGIQIDEVNCNILIANDAKDFISKVETLLIDKDLRLRIRRNARKTVESIYDWRVIGGQLASCLDSL
jgi:glycosyltransferase involved in cell wall biosynthesis